MPSLLRSSANLLLYQAKLRLVAEALKVGPGPQISYRQVSFGRSDLPQWTVGSPVATGIAGAAILTVDGAEELLAAAQPSALGRASLHGERVAPPLAGTLAAGMTVTGSTSVAGAAGAAALLPAGEPSAGSRPTAVGRPIGPTVVGFLPAGDQPAARVVATTVADPAPPGSPHRPGS